jgi:hypothetical protein
MPVLAPPRAGHCTAALVHAVPLKPRPHHLCHAPRMIAVRLINLRLQHCPSGLNTDHRQVRFSNRPFWVKHFQTIHHCRVMSLAGSMVPVACRRCIHLIAELGLTSNQSNASRRDASDSTTFTTRSRNSKGHGFGIDPPSRIRINAHQIQLAEPVGESRFNPAEIRSSSASSRHMA